MEETINGNLSKEDAEECLAEIEARLPKQQEVSFKGVLRIVKTCRLSAER